MPKKRVISAVFLSLAVAMVLFFTLQDAEGTTSLSEADRHWLGAHGINVESHALRSNIHILEYFILGLAVILFGSIREWKLGICLVVGLLIGLADEIIKIWIPTREFDIVDLIKDYIGIGLAATANRVLNIKAKER